MATMNSVNTTLSSQTGTISFVGSTSPTLVTPILGAASATSLSFSSTTEKIGTTTNNNAAAGSVGEFISSVVNFGSGIVLTTSTPADITSISLTAGDWTLWGNVGFSGNSATNVTFLAGWMSTTSATLPDPTFYSSLSYGSAGVLPFVSASVNFCVPTSRVRLTSTTTLYLSVDAIFTINACLSHGGIYARRAR
jgi:hypothetical protein